MLGTQFLGILSHKNTVCIASPRYLRGQQVQVECHRGDWTDVQWAASIDLMLQYATQLTWISFSHRYEKPEVFAVVEVPVPKLRDNDVLV
jgi:hypothetical protein